MSFQGSLESVLKVEEAKIGLGDAKPEAITLIGASGRRAELQASSDKSERFAKARITFQKNDKEQVEVAVISASTYELKYKDRAAKDDVAIAYVQYREAGRGAWIDLTTAHVYKHRQGIVEMSELYDVEFQVLAEAIPVEKAIKVEVYLGTAPAEKKDNACEEVPETQSE